MEGWEAMIEEVERCPTAIESSVYSEILLWLISAEPGRWMRVRDNNRDRQAGIIHSVNYHLGPLGIKAVTRKRDGFLYIGMK